MSELQNKVNSLRQPDVDSSNNNIQYLGNSKSINNKQEQNSSSFKQVIDDAKNMKGSPSSDMNELFSSLNGGKKPIVSLGNGHSNSFAVVNSIRGNNVELFDSAQEKPITMSLRQLYNAMNPKKESNST